MEVAEGSRQEPRTEKQGRWQACGKVRRLVLQLLHNLGYGPVCSAGKQVKAEKKDPPGVPAKNQKPASPSMEQ
eukprot:5270244-Amphidinium_carterae.1